MTLAGRSRCGDQLGEISYGAAIDDFSVDQDDLQFGVDQDGLQPKTFKLLT